MNASRRSRNRGRILAITIVGVIAAAAAPGIAQPARAVAPNLTLWDTLSPVADQLTAGDPSHWQVVPTELLMLEKDPPKAGSDPGYYGRDYSFKGDAVVETPALTAVFSSAKGCVAIYARQDSTRKESGPTPVAWPGHKTVEVSPVRADGEAATISHMELLRNADDEIVLEATFSPPSSPRIAGVFSFDRTGIVEVKPVVNMPHVRLTSPIAYGVVPDFVGDDLIFGGSENVATNALTLPVGNLFLGLLAGENTELVVTWPAGRQRLNLRPQVASGEGSFSAVDFDNDAQSFYLALLSAPGLWHREPLLPEFLEQDVKIRWQRPFPAKWRTQLPEEDVKTTFTFHESRGEVWRGVTGSYIYPVWFDGNEAFYHLSKKVQPKGESVIYCLEGRDTPVDVATPASILKQTLGRPAADSILDYAGRKLRTHHRRGADGVRRACTCGCTEAIEAVFQAGNEVGDKDYIRGALDDMIFFVSCHVERINEYRQFADDVLKIIAAKRQASPELKRYLDGLEEIVRQIPQECEAQKDNMKTQDATSMVKYANELSAKTLALTAKKDPANLPAYMQLLEAWRGMGGAQDYVVAKCHTVARNLFQAAGYGCASLPAALPVAEEIRVQCRQILRNPDGYEIWADY
jgi:hypothetical protein